MTSQPQSPEPPDFMTISSALALEQRGSGPVKSKQSAVQVALTSPSAADGYRREHNPAAPEFPKIPPMVQNIQVDPRRLLAELFDSYTRYTDLLATCVWGNVHPEVRVDITTPDGIVLIAQAPTSLVLTLEKTLQQLIDLARRIPVLDPGERWHQDPVDPTLHVSEVTEEPTVEKVYFAHVLVEATPDHPAQAKEHHEEKITGTWKTVKYSRAFPREEHRAFIERLEGLLDSVLAARTEVNQTRVERKWVAAPLFEYLLTGNTPQTSPPPEKGGGRQRRSSHA